MCIRDRFCWGEVAAGEGVAERVDTYRVVLDVESPAIPGRLANDGNDASIGVRRDEETGVLLR